MGVLLKLVRTLNDALSLTSVVVSHDVHEVLGIADYVYILAEGRVIGQGTPHDILSHEDEQVAQFVHGRPDGPVKFHYPAPSLQQDFWGDAADHS
jgi:phospholipid/cholesterol/gamma-HCH transport system ATP-binding protein